MAKLPKRTRTALDELREYANSLAPQKGFFSTLDELIQEAPFERAPAEQWRGYLQPGRMLKREGTQFPLKQEELDYVIQGLVPQIEGHPITKADLLAQIRSERPKFNLDVSATSNQLDLLEQLAGLAPQAMSSRRLNFPPPRYGGSVGDYRLSHQSPGSTYQESITRYPRIGSGRYAPEFYQHFAPDTLSWSRTSSHQLPSGEKMRLVEEIQSDIHETAAERTGESFDYLTEEEKQRLNQIQLERGELTSRFTRRTPRTELDPVRAREIDQETVEFIRALDAERARIYEAGSSRRPRRGYRTPEEQAELIEKETGFVPATLDELHEYDRRLQQLRKKIPDAPFKNPAEYARLELRKQLLNAVNNNEDYLALTTPEDQIQRYSSGPEEAEGMRYIYGQIYPSELRKLANRYGAEIVDVTAPLGTADADVRTEFMRATNLENGYDAAELIFQPERAGGAVGTSRERRNLATFDEISTEHLLQDLEKDPWSQEHQPRVIQNLRKDFDEIRDGRWKGNPDLAEELAKRIGEAIDAKLSYDASKISVDKTFPALRLTPEVRERIKRIGVPLWSMGAGALGIEALREEGESEGFAEGGPVVKEAGKEYVSAIDQLRDLANRVGYGVKTQWWGIDPTTGEAEYAGPSLQELVTRVPRIRSPLEAQPGIVHETLAIPELLSFIDEDLVPEISSVSGQKVDELGDRLREDMELPPPTRTRQRAAEALGVMLGQIPVPGGAVKKAGAGVLRKLGKIAGAVPEWFFPTIQPSVTNYALGTGAGTALMELFSRLEQSAAADQSAQLQAEIEAALESGDLSPEDAELLLNYLDSQGGKIESPGNEETYVTGRGFAKGGKVKPKSDQVLLKLIDRYKGILEQDGWETVELTMRDEIPDPEVAALIVHALQNKPKLHAKGGRIRPTPEATLALRERIAQLVSEAGVEGTGQEVVPVERIDPGTGEPVPDVEQQLEALEGRVREPAILETPVSRRDVLHGMASLASPIKVDPLSTSLRDPMSSEERAWHGIREAQKKSLLSPTLLASKLEKAFGWFEPEHSEGPYFDEARAELEGVEGAEGILESIDNFEKVWNNINWENEPEVVPGDVYHGLIENLEEEVTALANSKGLLVRPWREFTDEPLHVLTVDDHAAWEIHNFLKDRGEALDEEQLDEAQRLFADLTRNFRAWQDAPGRAWEPLVEKQKELLRELEKYGFNGDAWVEHMDNFAMRGRDF